MSTSSAVFERWHQAVEHTRRRSPASFEQWFSSVQLDALEERVVRLTARDEFVRDWVKTHFLPELVGKLDALCSVPGGMSVEWRIDASLDRPICAPPSVRAAQTLGSATTSGARAPQASSAQTYGAQADRGQAYGAQADRGQAYGAQADRGHADRGYGVQADRAQADRAQADRAQADRGHADRTQAQADRGQSSSRASQRPLITIDATNARSQLNAKYTFENFVVGPSNELAYAAALASAGGGGPRYNPLFIAGGTGLGKTHLMHAIAHKVLVDRPDARIVYVSAEHFTNEFIEALQNHRMDEFRARYRTQCDLLLLDDIQFLAGREQTQEEFFHTFNALHDAGVPIIVTSDKYPQQLQRMPERLVSRFTSGLVADVQVPQLETRVAIVKKKAQIECIDLSDEVAVLLAQKVQSNVRELEGALIRLAAKSSLTGRPIDEEFALSEMSMVAPSRREPVSVADIQRAVCNHFRLTNAELLSKDRHKSVAFARQVAMYLCRQRLKSSFPELGRAFGNRDHTTVMSAVRRVEVLRQKDPQVAAHLEAIEQRLAANDEN
jgi:chromosomal replication initiator protein